MPTVILSKNAEREFARLPKNDKQKIIRKLDLLQNEPFSGKPLAGQLRSLFSLRAWPYRVIYEQKPKRVIVHHIPHRQKACK